MKKQSEGLKERIGLVDRIVSKNCLELESSRNLVFELYKSLKQVLKTTSHLQNLCTLKETLLMDNVKHAKAQRVEYDILA